MDPVDITPKRPTKRGLKVVEATMDDFNAAQNPEPNLRQRATNFGNRVTDFAKTTFDKGAQTLRGGWDRMTGPTPAVTAEKLGRAVGNAVNTVEARAGATREAVGQGVKNFGEGLAAARPASVAPLAEPVVPGMNVANASMDDFHAAQKAAPAPQSPYAAKQSALRAELNAPTARTPLGQGPSMTAPRPAVEVFPPKMSTAEVLRSKVGEGAKVAASSPAAAPTRGLVARVAGKAAGPLAVLPEVLNDEQREFMMDPNVSSEQKLRQLGRAAFRVGGGMAGGAAGSVVAPVVGTLGGGLAGYYGGDVVGEKVFGDPMAGYKGRSGAVAAKGWDGKNPLADESPQQRGTTVARPGGAPTEASLNARAALRRVDNAINPDMAFPGSRVKVLGQDRGEDGRIPVGSSGDISMITQKDGKRILTNRDPYTAQNENKRAGFMNMDLRGSNDVLARANAIRASTIANDAPVDAGSSLGGPDRDAFGKTQADRDRDERISRMESEIARAGSRATIGMRGELQREFDRTRDYDLNAANNATLRRRDDLGLLTAREQNATTRRGQDVLARGQDLSNAAAMYGHEVDAYGRRLNYQSNMARLSAERAKDNYAAIESRVNSLYTPDQLKTPEGVAARQATMDRLIHTTREAGIDMSQLTPQTANEVINLVRVAEQRDVENGTLARRVWDIVRGGVTSTDRNALRYRVSGYDKDAFMNPYTDQMGNRLSTFQAEGVPGNPLILRSPNQMPDATRMEQLRILRDNQR